MPSVHRSNDMESDSSHSEDSTCEDAISSDDADSDETNKIVESESTAIFRFRLLAFLVMLFAAVGVSLTLYFLTADSENDEYHVQYDESVIKVITAFEEAGQKLAAISSLSVAATSYARSQPYTAWPFVTLNDFQQRAANIRELSNTLFLSIIPVISEEDRPAWEDYSIKNTIGPDGPLGDQGSGPYYPLWQASPHFGWDTTNFNGAYYPDYTVYVKKSVETGEMTMGGLDTAMPGNIHDPDLSTSFFARLLSFAVDKPLDYLGDPMSSVFVPVFDSFDTTKKPTAVIFSVFSWATYFEGLLPENTPGVVAVLENTCDGPFTYKVIGEKAEYMGQGDLHDSKFDGMEQAVDFARENDILDASLGSGVNQDICAYSLRVYPSQELYDESHTSLPIFITCMVALVFVITVGVFLLYSHRVERRQRIVLKQAMDSTAIVSSFFPEAVRDRYVAGNNQNGLASGKDRLKAFLADGDDGCGEIDDTPIADLFPHSTVFFADIAGFTSWSSCREPAQVFILLQTIYQAFDLIAKHRKVFKVETIGDSYVAVCGLPKADENHFVSMARFATDCLAKFTVLTNKLEEKLGPGTAALGLRVGLHR
jgi:class 3 adenylate cyclase